MRNVEIRHPHAVCTEPGRKLFQPDSLFLETGMREAVAPVRVEIGKIEDEGGAACVGAQRLRSSSIAQNEGIPLVSR